MVPVEALAAPSFELHSRLQCIGISLIFRSGVQFGVSHTTHRVFDSELEASARLLFMLAIRHSFPVFLFLGLIPMNLNLSRFHFYKWGS